MNDTTPGSTPAILQLPVNLITTVIGSLVLSAGALYNGYPLLYPDSGAYIENWYTGEYAAFRAHAYTFFVMAASGAGKSLWTVIFIQNLALSYVLQRAVERYAGGRRRRFLVFTFVAAVGFGATWVQSMIMPDAFTPVLLLSAGLLASPVPLQRTERRILAALFIFAAAAHFSHIVMALMIAALFRSSGLFKLSTGACVLAAAINLFCGIGMPHVQLFLMGRLSDTGLLRPYLESRCDAGSDLALCAKRQTRMDTAAATLWAFDGLLQNTHGTADTSEYASVIRGAITEHPARFLANEAAGWIRQLVTVGYGHNLDLGVEEFRHVIAKVLPGQKEQFERSRQASRTLRFTLPNMLLYLALAAGGVMSAYLFLHPPQQRIRALLTILIAGYFLNAFVCGTLSAVISRYQARVAWLVPAAACLALSRKTSAGA